MSTVDTTTTIPITMTTTGVQPQSPATLLAQLLANVSATNPGYTANLPGTLIEDISSTDVGALALCDAAFVELVNCIAPGSANAYVLQQLGQQFGIPQGVGYNTNVNVLFTGPAGFVISQGFTDGIYQYVVQNAAIIPTSGTTAPVYCLAILSGTWAVPADTVNQLVSSIPSGISLTVNNPLAGTPGTGVEPVQAYQARVVQAGLAACQGMTTTLRTAIQAVSGVQANLVSVLQKTGQWEIIVGGGDPYEVAFAIFTGMGDISNLVGSTLSVASISQANPGVITTNQNHGLTTGQVIKITGIEGMTELNGENLTVTVTGLESFSIGVNTTGYTAYTSGGVISPNPRNNNISINDYPDTYTIPFVTPPQQVVGITATWNTISSNYISPAAISAYAQPAMIAYVNGITVGQPLNLLDLQGIFQSSVASILPSSLLISLTFVVTINGVVTSPQEGSQIIVGDAESYFYTTAADITIVQE
jgi:hypothetical protein